MIVPMAKVQVLGPRSRLADTLRFLQSQGVLELRTVPTDEGEVAHAPVDDAEQKRLQAMLTAIDALLAALPDVESPSRSPPPPLDDIAAELRALDAERARLLEENEVATRYQHLVAALVPLRPALPPELNPHSIGLVLRRDRADALPLLERELRALVDSHYDLQWRELDRELLAVLLTIPSADAARVSALLFERGLEEVKLPERYTKQPLVRALLMLDARLRELPGELERNELAKASLARRVRGPLTALRRETQAQLDTIQAALSCAEIGRAFVIWGWVPRERVDGLAGAALRELGPGISVLDYPIEPRDYAEVPVVLHNRPFIRHFERLLALVPLPRYGTIDPTPLLAVFFPLFFGVVLGDLGFGALALGVLFALRRRLRGPFARDLLVIAATCAVSAMLFGLAFGEAFGGHVGLRPLVFDRRAAALTLLVVSLGLGTAHVVLGIALGAFDSARHGHHRETIGRAAHALLLLGAALYGCARAGWIALPDQWLWLLAALALAVIVFGGPLGLLELVLSMGHVLSYARLMALGLASVILADLANRIAGTLHPAALGWSLALVLHAVNFSLGLISPTVCALRLHYVEFFEKFYEGGGRGFHPLALPPQEGVADV